MLPGLWNSHSHLGDLLPDPKGLLPNEPLLRASIRAGRNAMDALKAGILEIEQLAFHGIPAMGAIQAATRNSAEMMGMLDDLGTVEVGKLADLIVLEKNPLEHISHMRSLSMVIKDGKIVNRSRDEGQASFWELYLQD